jgi:hypothetical protein
LLPSYLSTSTTAGDASPEGLVIVVTVEMLVVLVTVVTVDVFSGGAGGCGALVVVYCGQFVV